MNALVQQTLKCPACGRENVPETKVCEWGGCDFHFKTERECLWSIDEQAKRLVDLCNTATAISASLRTIKRVAIWFLILSMLGLILGLIAMGNVRY